MRKIGLVVALLAAGLVPFLSPAPVGAGGGGSTITVTTTVDELNGTGDNVISLREAVGLAATDGGNTQIRLPDGFIDLTRCGDPDEDGNATGDLDSALADTISFQRVQPDAEPVIRQTCADERVIDSAGAVTLTFVDVTGGTALSSGGGVLATSNILLTGAEVYGNTSGASGGGLYSAFTVTLQSGSVVRDNEATFDGGGIRAGEFVNLTDSQVTDNEAGGNGGGIRALGSGDVQLIRSTVGRNVADDGGGIHLETGGSVVLEDATVAQNRSTSPAGGTGGILAADQVVASQSTIASNETDGAAGFANISTLTLSANETVIADPVGGPNCSIGTAPSDGYNVEEGDDSCELDAVTDLQNTGDPGLQRLFFNGGAAETLYLAKTSFLRDLTPTTSNACANTDDYDERLVERPQGPLCDTGAVEIRPCGEFFGDVGASHPFCWEIGWMSEAGISTGFGSMPPDYRPNQVVTRQSMSAFLYRLAGSPEFEDPPTATFSDVATTSTFFTEIEWMNAAGITTGFPGGLYKPADPVKRQSMSAFMFRMVDPSFTDPPTATFSDVATTSTFFTEIEWMADENITTGFPGGLFKPNQDVTRQSMSAFMFRLAPFVSGGVQF